MNEAPAKLKKKVGFVDIVSLGVGTAVGVSIFAALAPATKLAGPGMLVALAIAAVPMGFFAVIYSFLGSSVPTSGASYEWPRRFIHPFVGFMVAWLRVAGSVAAMILLAQALVQYLSMVAPVAMRTPVIAAAFFTVWALNSIGVSIAVRAQLLLLLILLVTLCVLTVVAAPFIRPVNYTPFMPHGVGGVIAAAPLLIGLFFGIEAATEMGEEVKAGARAIPAGIMISVGVAALIYLVVALVSVGVLGGDRLAASPAPLLEVGKVAMGAAGGPLIATVAAVTIGKTINGVFMILSRSLMAMGRSGVLPTVLAKVHPKLGTPWVATTTAFALCLAGLLLPPDLVLLFLAVNIPNLLKYAATSIAAVRAMDQDPGIYERATVRLPKTWMRAWCWAGAAMALALIIAGWSADWRPYAALGAWALIGTGYYLLRYAWYRPVARS